MDDGSGMSEVLATATQNAAETGLDICCRQAHGEDVDPEPVRLCHIPASSRDNAHRTNVDQTRAFSETLSLYSYIRSWIHVAYMVPSTVPLRM